MHWQKDVLTIKLEVPWYEVKKQGKRITASRELKDKDGFPLDIHHEHGLKLYLGLKAACDAVGIRFLGYAGKPARSNLRYCHRCDQVFEATRSTARYCKECRAFRRSHEGRKERDGYYKERNEMRVALCRKKKGKQEETWKELSKIPLNRRKKRNVN
jgi:hypothetical protein